MVKPGSQMLRNFFTALYVLVTDLLTLQSLSLPPLLPLSVSCTRVARLEHCPRTVEGDAHELADDVYDGQQHWTLPNHDVRDDGVSPSPGSPELQGR